jgi:voltage-gated potassium channel
VLIVATAESDEMIPKLYQAGADRVVSPFDIAARFVLMATMRPIVSEFVIYVLFNRQTGLETTELYMDEGLPWVGQTLAELDLDGRYEAGVIGIRTTDGRFIYSPDARQRISHGEVLIVVTPMRCSDQLRTEAYGDSDKRPKSLRRARAVPLPSY